MKILFAVWLLVLLGACGGGGGGSDSGSPSGPSGASPQTAIDSINSTELRAPFGLTIYMPASYAQGTRTYPVIYALDGDTRFARLTNVMRATNAEAILVGINAEGRRFQDFLAPGSEAYYRFLTRELIPHIETRYRVNPARRALSGHSLGGFFVLSAMLREAPGQRFFHAILAADPSLQFEEALMPAEQMAFDRSRELPVKLALSSQTFSVTTSFDVFRDRLASRSYTGLQIDARKYPQNHNDMDAPAFTDALTFFLREP